MIVFGVAAAMLALAAAVTLVRTVWRPRGEAATRAACALAAYRKQLAEVDRDVQRGLLAEGEAEALRTEVKRRMLAAADEAESGGADARPLPRRGPALALALAVPAAAFALYAVLGQPAAPDQPLAQRRSAAETAEEQSAEFAGALAALEKHLEGHPEDARGWLLLGRAYRSEGRFGDAASALREAYERLGRPPELAADYGEAMIAADGGRIVEPARQLMQQAQAADAFDARARFYLALAKAQGGDVGGALQGWVDLAALAPPDAPFMPVVREHIARAAAALGLDPAGLTPSAEARALAAGAASPPSADEVEAAERMTAEERTAMVRGMVDRLAARLVAEPDDRQGWLRLAQAYDVLGEPEKAAEARAKADALGAR